MTYFGNFGNSGIFSNLKRIVQAAGYEDVKGPIDTLYCLVDAIKTGSTNSDKAGLAMSAGNKDYLATKDIIKAFEKVISESKLSFDDRIRRDIKVSLYLDSTYFNIKTTFMNLDQHRGFYKAFIQVLIDKGLFICKGIETKIDPKDFYLQIYENSKAVITNMNKRGMSIFAIACYFYHQNKDFIATPFMRSWASLNFIHALISTRLFEQEASDYLKGVLTKNRVYWTVFSELSLMTGKCSNIDSRRKELNQIIAKVLDAEGEEYIKNFLKRVKLTSNQNPISLGRISVSRDFLRAVEHQVRDQLRAKTTKIPSKETIIESIKYQFLMSKVIDVDFSSKRKDHVILNKVSRQRIFDIL